MLRWLQRWLQPASYRSVEALSVDANDLPILTSDSEWIIEIEGRPVALLSDPKQAEMFWNSYRMTPLTDEPKLLADLQNVEFWRHCEARGVAFRHRASSKIARYAFPGGDPFPEPGRLVMRGLYK